MPDSTITELEWESLVSIMQYKLGNDAFTDKFNGLAVLQRQEYAFNQAMTELLLDQSLIDAWNSDSITIEQQDAIDGLIRFYIENETELTASDQIIPRMPFSTLTHDDMELLDYIYQYQIDDLWIKAFDLNQYDRFNSS